MPSLSVSLSASEYAEVAKRAKKEDCTPNALCADLIRVALKENA